MRALKAGVIYFLLVFAVGWILGPILSCRNGQIVRRTIRGD
jgi:hypothetical protein